MPTELEQRARELLAAEYERRGYRHQAAGVRAGTYPAYDEQKDIFCKAIAAALQAQQPINGDVESSKPAAVPSVDGGPGNYVAPASPPSQQPDAQAVGYIDEGDDGSGMFAEFYPDRDLSVGAKLYTQPPSIPDPSEEDIGASIDAHGPALADGTAWSAMRAALTTYTARLRERIGGEA
jgi:hypothetical protein